MEKQIVYLLHIGKTGGSTLRHIINNLSEGQRLQLKYQVKTHKQHDLSLARVTESERCVFFLRDPLAIAISGFYSRKRMGRPLYNSPHSPDEARVFSRFETFDALANALADGEHPEHALAREAFQVVRHMHDVLCKFLGSAEEFEQHKHKVIFIGDFDRFVPSCQKMLRILGLQELPDIPHLHQNPVHDTKLGAKQLAALEELLEPHRGVYKAARKWMLELEARQQ